MLNAGSAESKKTTKANPTTTRTQAVCDDAFNGLIQSIIFNITVTDGGVVALDARFEQLQCNSDGSAVAYKLSATRISDCHATSASDRALCASCVWDVMSSLSIGYIRLSNGSTFLFSRNTNDFDNLTPDVVANFSRQSLLFPNEESDMPEAAEQWLKAEKDNSPAAAYGALPLARARCPQSTHKQAAAALLSASVVLLDLAWIETRRGDLDYDKVRRMTGIGGVDKESSVDMLRLHDDNICICPINYLLHTTHLPLIYHSYYGHTVTGFASTLPLWVCRTTCNSSKPALHQGTTRPSSKSSVQQVYHHTLPMVLPPLEGVAIAISFSHLTRPAAIFWTAIWTTFGVSSATSLVQAQPWLERSYALNVIWLLLPPSGLQGH